jgi:hypothetical protein
MIIWFRHQTAFIRGQLEEIVNDPELNLPHLMNDKTIFQVDEIASRLHTQLWFIRRVLCCLGIGNMYFLNQREIHLLTRALTGSFAVRTLLFFDVIDVDGDHRVSREEFIQFFIDYLDGIPSLKIFNEAEDGERRRTVLRIILTKFHLNEASYIDFDQFYELVINDQLLKEILSKFTVPPTW